VNILPTVLVAGGEEVMSDLSAALPQGTCRLIYNETAAQTLQHAADSTVIVVDERLPGAVGLCQRLRADPSTAAVPIVLRSQRAIQVPESIADAAVLAADINGLVQVLRQLLPTHSAPLDTDAALWSDLPEENELFDDAEATVIWRKPDEDEDGAGDWPPPPPTYVEGHDRVEFAVTFSGYMNSLLEALEDPSKLSPEEQGRLHEAAQKTIAASERCLAQVQTGVNEALMAKDLAQMKVLTSAKNSLYDKLQRMRKLFSELKPAPASGGSAPRSSDMALEELGLPSRRAPGKKSQITLAAEAKEAAQRAAQQSAIAVRQKQKKKQQRAEGTARKGEGERIGGPTWLWIVVALVAVGGSVSYIVYSFTHGQQESTTTAQGPNSPPRMQRVDISQTPAGIYARPMALDAERDRVSFSFQWFVNGAEHKTNRTSRLPPQEYKTGDQIEVIVTPRDPYAAGGPMRSRPHMVKNQTRRAPTPGPAAGNQTPR